VSTAFSQVPDTRPSNFDSVMGECYMGDYNQVTPGEAGALLHSWGDNRNAAMGNHPGRRTPASSTAFKPLEYASHGQLSAVTLDSPSVHGQAWPTE
jgi:hypothetical protein